MSKWLAALPPLQVGQLQKTRPELQQSKQLAQYTVTAKYNTTKKSGLLQDPT
jgi:hypothetical protein